jgi:hypothetical protein
MTKLGQALATIMCGLSVSFVAPAWAVDACRREASDLRLSQKRLDKIDQQIDKAKNRVDGAESKKGIAIQTGRTLIANAELQSDVAKATSAAVSASCAATVLIGLLTRNPERVTYGGRQYSCAARSLASLITKITLANALVNRAKARAEALKDRAQKYLDRMEARLVDYQQDRPAILAERDEDKAKLDACRVANPVR